MIRYVGLKLGTAFLALWGVASLVFFLFTVLPGDPAQMMMDQNEDSTQLEVIKSKFGFDLPIATQYFYYLNDLVPISIHSKDPLVFGYYDEDLYGGWILTHTKNKVYGFISLVFNDYSCDTGFFFGHSRYLKQGQLARSFSAVGQYFGHECPLFF